MATQFPRPVPDGMSVGSPPLRRPRGPPPRPPLLETCGPLRRPCRPQCRPALLRFFRHIFPTYLIVLPFVLSSPHGFLRYHLVGIRGGGFPVYPPLSCASPCSSPATLFCVSHTVAAHFSLPHSAPPVFVASSFVADPSDSLVLLPLHSSLVLLLPSWPSPLAWCSLLLPSLLTWS